jgi:hypothetical protein
MNQIELSSLYSLCFSYELNPLRLMISSLPNFLKIHLITPPNLCKDNPLLYSTVDCA